jgi:formylglycine-generating enzyme required for sulfatase activity
MRLWQSSHLLLQRIRCPLAIAVGLAIGGTVLGVGCRGSGQSPPQQGGRAQRRPGAAFRDCDECPEMVVVPAGSFMMGSPPSEFGRVYNESPQHRVTIDYDFAIGKFPVTRAEYARFAAESGYNADYHWKEPGYLQNGNYPAGYVSWDDVKAYVRWLSDKSGSKYRLPSEAEYEYAERAGTTTANWWRDGADALCSYVECSDDGIGPVGSHPANAFGLCDMAGGVHEWTEDCWHRNHDGAPTDGTARTTWWFGRCDDHATRGGGGGGPAWLHRSAIRQGYFSDDRANISGFRVARTL